MSKTESQPFGPWRSRLWPIHSYELKKLLPMFFMFFCISFNYTILRDAKDALVVTGAGAEAIPFLKFWGVVPCAILFTLAYAKLSNILSREGLFYASLIPFLIFFGLFAAVIFPNREVLAPHAFCDGLLESFGSGWAGLIGCIRQWPFALFYILAELWGSVVLSLLFWKFANEITRVTEAKRFYALLGLGANVALIFSGQFIRYCTSVRTVATEGFDAEQASINLLMGGVVVMGLLIMVIYNYIVKNILTDKRFYDAEEMAGAKKKKKSKPKLSIGESIRFLATSRYLQCLCVLVMCYGVAINLVEVTWKSQLKVQYPDLNDYTNFMGRFSQVTGLVTVFMLLFVGGNALRRGWGFAAIITPIVLAVTGSLFFSFVLFQDAMGGLVALLGMTPLWMAVIFGAAQNIMSKSAKYSLFDPTKEMAYIPLDADSKVKGKAAIDVIGARLGKSGGSLAQQFLLLAFGGSITAIGPYVAVLMLVVVGLWIVAVRSLSVQFNELTAAKEEESTPSEAPAQEKASGEPAPAAT